MYIYGDEYNRYETERINTTVDDRFIETALELHANGSTEDKEAFLDMVEEDTTLDVVTGYVLASIVEDGIERIGDDGAFGVWCEDGIYGIAPTLNAAKLAYVEMGER